MTAQTAASPVDVSLVLMPYASLERPSIALSILKASLALADISSRVVYANVLLAEEIGAQSHDIIGKTQSHSLAGEWTFAGAAFPDFESDREEYFAHIAPGLRALVPLVRQHGGRGRMTSILESVRSQAPAFIDRVARRVLAESPKIVGCSSTFQQHCASLALLRRIKELAPSIVTVMGGANCEASMGLATHRECPWLDYVVSGEAEQAFPELCRRVLGHRPASRVLQVGPDPTLPDGVIGPEHRANGYATIGDRPPRAIVHDMDTSPLPDYDDYFVALANSDVGLYVKPGLLIETSRGCWWGAVSHCTFCGLNGTNMAFRSKSPERVIESLAELSARYDATSFEVVDNILDMSYFKELIPALAERNDGYDIFFETKANLSRRHLRLLSQAGITWLQPGIESLDDGILKAIAKGTTTRQNLQLLKWAQDYGIYVLWILLYDIPGESDEAYAEMAEWLPLIAHLQPPSGFSFIQYNRFSPYQQRPEEFGLQISPDRSYGYVYPWGPASLEDVAYFFDDYTIDRESVHALDDCPGRPGLRQVYETMAGWQVQWMGRMNAGAESAPPPTLTQTPDDGQLLIVDTRDCRTADEFVLDSLAARVYEACDSAQSRTSLLRTLGIAGLTDVTWEQVDPILQQLIEDKLVLDLGSHYFSLASRGPLPEMPDIARYPGGRLRTNAEAQAAEMMRYATAQVAGSQAGAVLSRDVAAVER